MYFLALFVLFLSGAYTGDGESGSGASKSALHKKTYNGDLFDDLFLPREVVYAYNGYY